MTSPHVQTTQGCYDLKGVNFVSPADEAIICAAPGADDDAPDGEKIWMHLLGMADEHELCRRFLVMACPLANQMAPGNWRFFLFAMAGLHEFEEFDLVTQLLEMVDVQGMETDMADDAKRLRRLNRVASRLRSARPPAKTKEFAQWTCPQTQVWKCFSPATNELLVEAKMQKRQDQVTIRVSTGARWAQGSVNLATMKQTGIGPNDVDVRFVQCAVDETRLVRGRDGVYFMVFGHSDVDHNGVPTYAHCMFLMHQAALPQKQLSRVTCILSAVHLAQFNNQMDSRPDHNHTYDTTHGTKQMENIPKIIAGSLKFSRDPSDTNDDADNMVNRENASVLGPACYTTPVGNEAVNTTYCGPTESAVLAQCLVRHPPAASIPVQSDDQAPVFTNHNSWLMVRDPRFLRAIAVLSWAAAPVDIAELFNNSTDAVRPQVNKQCMIHMPTPREILASAQQLGLPPAAVVAPTAATMRPHPTAVVAPAAATMRPHPAVVVRPPTVVVTPAAAAVRPAAAAVRPPAAVTPPATAPYYKNVRGKKVQITFEERQRLDKNAQGATARRLAKKNGGITKLPRASAKKRQSAKPAKSAKSA